MDNMKHLKRNVLFYPFEYRLYSRSNKLLIINDNIYQADFLKTAYEIRIHIVKKYNGTLYTNGRYMIMRMNEFSKDAFIKTSGMMNIYSEESSISQIIMIEKIYKIKDGQVFTQIDIICKAKPELDGELGENWKPVEGSTYTNRKDIFRYILRAIKMICNHSFHTN
jgi:hypothetical protein